MDAVNNPEDANAGTRKVPFSRVLYIEHDDFREDPPKGYFRLSPGREVRLRYGYFITAQSVVKNDRGEVVEVHCTYDPASRGGNSPDGRKVKSTIHWVSAAHAVDAEVRIYETLFSKENPDDVEPGQDFTANLNPNSLEVIRQAKLEPSLATAPVGGRYQFERLGYFCVDLDSKPGKPVFNRTVALKDAWAKVEKRGNVMEMHGPGPCEAQRCQRELRGEDRIIKHANDGIRVRGKNYHKGCEPSQREIAAKDLS
jgi:glutaminyl-tRNA synthetase